jgi:hypothetical protein
LQACAVLGKNATLERVEAMLDQPRTNLLDAFDELEHARLVFLQDGKLACQHGLLLEAALARASKAAFSYLHRKAGTTMALALRRDCQVSLAWDCARHFLSAGEPSQATALLMDCARHALELGRPLDADEILKSALDLPLSPTDRAAILAERSHALRAADQWDDVVRVLSELTALQSPGGRLEHNDHELQLISAKWAAGHDAKGLLGSLRDCCIQKISAPTHRLLAARSAFMVADNICECQVANDIYQVIAADLASQNAPEFDRLYCSMVYNAAFGDITAAEYAARELNGILAGRPDIREICLARTHVAEVLREAGHPRESLSLLQAAYREAIDNSLLWLACLAGRRLAWQYLDSGDYRTAAEWVEAVLPLSERIQHLATRADALGAAAELALHNGDVDLAAGLLERSAAAWKNTQHARSQAFWLASQAGVWLAREDRSACLNALPRFLELYEIVRRHCDQDQTTARLVRVLDFTGQSQLADRILHEYVCQDRRGRAPLSAELTAVCDRRDPSCVNCVDTRKERGHAPAA